MKSICSFIRNSAVVEQISRAADESDKKVSLNFHRLECLQVARRLEHDVESSPIDHKVNVVCPGMGKPRDGEAE